MYVPSEVRQVICKQCARYQTCSHIGSDTCHILMEEYRQNLGAYAGKGKHEAPTATVAQAGTETTEDVVNNPQHYQHGTFEVIDEMLIAFGPEKTFTFCILNAWKYRSRAPYKGKPEEDMDKADRYMQMARSIAAKNPDAFPVYTHLIKNEDDS